MVREPAVVTRQLGQRLLRVLDAHLALVDQARSPTRHVVVDLSATVAADAAALDALKHAAFTTGRLHLGLHLVGSGRLIANLPLSVHRHLSRFSSYPTVQAALHALTVTRI